MSQVSGGSKRFHNKSRNGCGQCKRRRVKCNFRPPVCSNCWKRDEVCDYQFRDDTFQTQSHIKTLGSGIISTDITGFLTASPRRVCHDVGAITHTPPPSLFLTSTRIFRQLYDPLFDDHLSARLMEHYLARTSVEFVPLADSNLIWSREIIHASSLYPFLRHSLVAISGLHLCRTSTENRKSYYYAACHHAIKASHLFRSSVTNLNVQNWIPVAAFIINSTIFNFDISFFAPTFDNSSQAISPISILRILRGPRSLYHGVNPLILSLPHADVLIGKLRQRRFPLDEGVMTAIDRLEVFCATKTAIAGGLVCATAIQTLKRWASFVSCQPRMWVHFFSWPAEVSDEYVLLVESGCALANVIFVYWCAIMKRAPAIYYLTGTMKTLAYLAIRNCDSEFDELLQWPRDEIESRT